MDQANLRSITNCFLDVRLASLASWKQASEFNPRDAGGPYVVTQEGYDPQDPKMIGQEFILGRSGRWLPLSIFYRMPIPERREEFVFGTAGEIMQLMADLPNKVTVFRGDGKETEEEPAAPGTDEMAAAIKAGKE